PNVYKYVVFDLLNHENVKVIDRPVEQSIEVVSGVMEGSLWETIKKYNMDTDLASQMEDAMECAMDLSRSGKGDMIKLVYEKNIIEGEEVDAGKLLAAYYKGRLGEKYVFYFDNGKYKGYFDQDGRPMKKSYLASPLKYAKITSKFSMSRLHPILNKVVPHFGTDYAAPTGTPILAVSDGVIEAQGYGGGNGNYVKIKHDRTYSTQYLHMSRFPKGQRKGQRVRQGQVIGYVGSTGLATGPHVCFRFWKNGRQVNPKSCKLPAPNPIPGSSLTEFKALRNDMLSKLAAIGKPLPGETLVKKSEDELFLIEP
ncbi:MAG TPA: peptidoglycan DD-metalloendopeptidase family protein, partial [Saprospiraceae bacterium]|nr:peptidoglycan DD-metalloendopeptidase family protein [Saprospiraceae bacterium]